MLNSLACLLWQGDTDVIICDNKQSTDYDKIGRYKDVKLYKSLEDCIKVIDSLLKECEVRSKQGGKHKKILLVIDEIFPFLTFDSKVKKMAYNKLALLLSRCRSSNIFVWIAVQKATDTIVPNIITCNLGVRVCLRCSSDFESRYLLGNDLAYHINNKGVGYYCCNNQLEKFKFPKYHNSYLPLIQEVTEEPNEVVVQSEEVTYTVNIESQYIIRGD